MTPAGAGGPGGAATFARFLAAGAANTALTLVAYWLLLPWAPPQAAYALSFALGVCTGYLLHTGAVFRARRGWRSFLAWPLVCLAGWAAGAGALQLGLGPLGLDPRVAPLLSIAASVPVTFLLARRVLGPRPAP